MQKITENLLEGVSCFGCGITGVLTEMKGVAFCTYLSGEWGHEGFAPICIECAKKVAAYIPTLKKVKSDYPVSLFWDCWKRLGGKKGDAKKVEAKYLKHTETIKKTIIEGLEAQIHARCVMIKNNSPFVPNVKHASTWMNGECWNDEVPNDKDIVDEANRERVKRITTKKPYSASWDDSV